MIKHFLLSIAAILLAGCNSAGPLNITSLPVGNETIEKLSGDITDTSVQKEALFTNMVKNRDNVYKALYPNSGTKIEFELVEAAPGVKIQMIKSITSREAPRFAQALPTGPSEHPFWGTAKLFLEKGFSAFISYEGITEGAGVIKSALGAAQPKYYGNYNPQTAEPFVLHPEVIQLPGPAQ
jgi:hypothetical protein